MLTVDPGDTVLARSLDAVGYLARHEFPGDEGQPKMFPGEFRGHCLTGPISVRGARPGDMLAVRLVSLHPDEWGWTIAPTVPDSPVTRRLGLAGAESAWLLWEIDADAGKATANGKYTRPLAPFLGVTGVAPAGPGEHSTVPPRAETGGNIDCKELMDGRDLRHLAGGGARAGEQLRGPAGHSGSERDVGSARGAALGPPILTGNEEVWPSTLM